MKIAKDEFNWNITTVGELVDKILTSDFHTKQTLDAHLKNFSVDLDILLAADKLCRVTQNEIAHLVQYSYCQNGIGSVPEGPIRELLKRAFHHCFNQEWNL